MGCPAPCSSHTPPTLSQRSPQLHRLYNVCALRLHPGSSAVLGRAPPGLTGTALGTRILSLGAPSLHSHAHARIPQLCTEPAPCKALGGECSARQAGPCSREPTHRWGRQRTEKQRSRCRSRVSITVLLELLPQALRSSFCRRPHQPLQEKQSLPSLLTPSAWIHHPADPFAPQPPLFSRLGGWDRFLLFEASTVTGQELAGSESGSDPPGVCGLLTSWRKDFARPEYAKSVCVIGSVFVTAGAVKPGRATGERLGGAAVAH